MNMPRDCREGLAKGTVLAAATLLALAGCEDRRNNNNNPGASTSGNAGGSGTSSPSGTTGTGTAPATRTNPPPPTGNPPTTTGNAGAYPPDNTGRNERDRSASNLTPMDQSETAADREISASIRRAVVADGQLSMSAHNCKIITRGGVVTLRGPVNTAAEKATIETLARGVPGVTNVVNELEVKSG